MAWSTKKKGARKIKSTQSPIPKQFRRLQSNDTHRRIPEIIIPSASSWDAYPPRAFLPQKSRDVSARAEPLFEIVGYRHPERTCFPGTSMLVTGGREEGGEIEEGGSGGSASRRNTGTRMAEMDEGGAEGVKYGESTDVSSRRQVAWPSTCTE
ncbi:hypothetical protein KM043_016778 [Ampulex compressa]|nr:hypothetical protein KM043_016778 [Ampulex compressa]